MMESGVGVDEVALVGAVSACAQLGARKYAGWVSYVAEPSGVGVERNAVVGSAFVDMYLKCGMLEDACEIFQCMIKRNLYSYSSLILSHVQDEKKRILMYHSEKLALVFAFLNPDDGATIRIMKNIRICEDCHWFMCVASKLKLDKTQITVSMIQLGSDARRDADVSFLPLLACYA
ncbi:Pentatricopeptide repeat-containing protein [Drosera capensis]